VCDGAGAARAVSELERALVFDSASAYCWANLGEGFFNAGNLQSARYSFLQAVGAGPRNPAILMRAANFSFSDGDSGKMMQYGSAILRDPKLADYYAPIFLTYARAGAPIDKILERGIPSERVPAQAFLRFLIEGNTKGDPASDAAAEAKRVEAAKQRSTAARRAGSSVTGSPNGVAANGPRDSLRAEIEALNKPPASGRP